MPRHISYGNDSAVDIGAAEELLSKPPQTLHAQELGRQLAAAIDALLDEVGLLVPSREDRKNLQIGADALACSMVQLEDRTDAELAGLRVALVGGVTALQSIENLGSDEANGTLHADWTTLSQRVRIVSRVINSRATRGRDRSHVKQLIIEFDEGSLSTEELIDRLTNDNP